MKVVCSLRSCQQMRRGNVAMENGEENRMIAYKTGDPPLRLYSFANVGPVLLEIYPQR